MRSDEDRWREFENDWQSWLTRPARPAPASFAARGTGAIRGHRSGILAAVAGLAAVLLIAAWLLPGPGKLPEVVTRKTEATHSTSPWREVTIPLGRHQAVFWIDQTTPLYISLDPQTPNQDKGAQP